MIRLYWKGKRVSPLYEQVEITENSRPYRIRHGGFGVIVRRQGWFLVYGKFPFIVIDAGGGHLEIEGQGKGVFGFGTLATFLKAVLSRDVDAYLQDLCNRKPREYTR